MNYSSKYKFSNSGASNLLKIIVLVFVLFIVPHQTTEAQIFKDLFKRKQVTTKPKKGEKPARKLRIRPLKTSYKKFSGEKGNTVASSGRTRKRSARKAEKAARRTKDRSGPARRRFTNAKTNRAITNGSNLNKSPRDGERSKRKLSFRPRSKSGRRLTNGKINRSITNAPNLNKKPRDGDEPVWKLKVTPPFSKTKNYVKKVKTPYGKLRNGFENGNVSSSLPQKKYKTPGATHLGRIKSRKTRIPQSKSSTYSGNYVVKGRPKQSKASLYSGNIAVRKKPSQNRSSTFSGFIKTKGRRTPPSPASTFSGNYPVPKRTSLNKRIASYTGFLIYKGRPKQGPGQVYSGNIKVKKNSRRLDKQRYNYTGTLSLKRGKRNVIGLLTFYLASLKIGIKDNDPLGYRKTSKKIYAYRGNYKIKSRVKKGHPSSRYRGTLASQSYLPRDKVRKFNIWFTRLFSNQQQPKDVKKPIKKPRYDSREHEIWND